MSDVPSLGQGISRFALPGHFAPSPKISEIRSGPARGAPIDDFCGATGGNSLGRMIYGAHICQFDAICMSSDDIRRGFDSGRA